MKIFFNFRKWAINIISASCAILLLFQTAGAQNDHLTLRFKGRNVTTGDTVPLHSVLVTNTTQSGDTMLYGSAPSLTIPLASAIFDQLNPKSASFILEQNYPNPFEGKTTVDIYLIRRKNIVITLHDQLGNERAANERELNHGTHRFEVSVPQKGYCLLTVGDGDAVKTIKLYSNSGQYFDIDYLGEKESLSYKEVTQASAFVFSPGDMLKFTVNAVGYYEHTSFDNPTGNKEYIFDLQANINQQPPAVTTATISGITPTSATGGGNVTSQGSAAVTARGVCWSTSPNPTLANSYTLDGTGTGQFTSSLSDLTGNATYFVRAYATNQFGTAYGTEVSFVAKQQLFFYVVDSLIGLKFIGDTPWKEKYFRDEDGNTLQVLFQRWNSDQGLWANTSRYAYTYDAQGNQLSFIDQNWNSQLGNWANYSQELYTYDAQGNRLSIIRQGWNTKIGNWENQSYDIYSYNSQGNLISEIYQNWNTQFYIWENSAQALFKYDTQGNQLSSIHQNWNSQLGNWANLRRLLYTYDAQGNRLSRLFQSWNTQMGDWENKWNTFYSYDAQGNRLSNITQIWNSQLGNWANYSQELYTYDAQGNPLSWIDQNWNSQLGNWANYSQYLWTYDAQGNQLSEISQIWDNSNGAWMNLDKYEYSFDYSTKKILAMGFEWSGIWIPTYCGFNIYIFDYLLCSPYGYKVELWYKEFPLKNSNSTLFPGSYISGKPSFKTLENSSSLVFPFDERMDEWHGIDDKEVVSARREMPKKASPSRELRSNPGKAGADRKH